MRVALVRSDIGRVYLDDVENTSQRDFSAEPPGQSRYFEVPTDAQITSMLAGVAFVTSLGTNAQPFDTTVANGAKLNIRTSATASFTQITISSAAGQTAASIVTQLNAAFLAAGIGAVARATAANHVAIDTTVGGPNGYLEISAATPSAAALQTVLGLAVAATSGLTVAQLKTAVYIGASAIPGQTGAAAVITSVLNGYATVTTLTGMTSGDVGRCITFSGSTHPTNNGTFRITQFLSATSVVIANVDAVVDAGPLTWTEYANLTIDVSAATINALSTFANLSAAQQTALDNAIANLIAPSLVETGPVLLSFAFGKLSKLFNPAYQPGTGVSSAYPFGEGALTRLPYPPGAAVAIVANDGHTIFTL